MTINVHRVPCRYIYAQKPKTLIIKPDKSTRKLIPYAHEGACLEGEGKKGEEEDDWWDWLDWLDWWKWWDDEDDNEDDDSDEDEKNSDDY